MKDLTLVFKAPRRLRKEFIIPSRVMKLPKYHQPLGAVPTLLIRLIHNSTIRGRLAFLYGLMLFLFCGCAATSDAPFHPIVLRAKETSLYTNKVDWESVDREFRRLIDQPESTAGLRTGLEYLINALGDKHGTARLISDGSVVASYTGPDEGDIPWDPAFLQNVIHDTSAEFEHSLLNDNIGYLRVVGIGPGDVNEQARQIRAGLSELSELGIRGWVLDLRFNGGGNMNPMMAGLAPLFSEGFVGGSVDAGGRVVRHYKILNGVFFEGDRQVTDLKPGPDIETSTRIAVLLSRYTVSSGELVATALQNRDNTLFIGEQTAGYTTGTGYEDIGWGLLLTISESVFVDGDMGRHPNGLAPDIYSEFDPDQLGHDDDQLRIAVEWLHSE